MKKTEEEFLKEKYIRTIILNKLKEGRKTYEDIYWGVRSVHDTFSSPPVIRVDAVLKSMQKEGLVAYSKRHWDLPRSYIEAKCPHCNGSGYVREEES